MTMSTFKYRQEEQEYKRKSGKKKGGKGERRLINPSISDVSPLQMILTNPSPLVNPTAYFVPGLVAMIS